MRKVRTRFAPSPTGSLHVGNVRIAVFNWLYTRRHGGSFIVRVEDTDLDRNLAGSESVILEDLRWLGLDWDEGPDVGGPMGPYRQSERMEQYRWAAERLVAEGKAYPCYCSETELEEESEEVGGGETVLRYSGRCRELGPQERARLQAGGRTPAIRFAMPPGEIIVQDEVRGSIRFIGSEFGDFILLRGDGRPTYNFAVVVDDVLMEVTHVIRGVGHLSNTPKQAVLFDALGAARPVFAHLSMVLGADRRKLSKREGAAAVGDLRELGYHPGGVLNYLSLLGWSSPDEREILSPEELIERIGFERAGVSDTVFDPEKLHWVSSQHIASMDLEEVVRAVEPWVDRERFGFRGEALTAAVAGIRTRLGAFSEINDYLDLYSELDEARMLEARREVRRDAASRSVVAEVRDRLAALPVWEEGALRESVRAAGGAVGARGPALFHPVRMALTGMTAGPDLGKTMVALGRGEVLWRLDRTVEMEGGTGWEEE